MYLYWIWHRLLKLNENLIILQPSYWLTKKLFVCELLILSCQLRPTFSENKAFRNKTLFTVIIIMIYYQIDRNLSILYETGIILKTPIISRASGRL